MAQYVLINPVGTRHAGEVLDSVQDGQAVINQLAAFGGVLVPLPNSLLQPYIDRCQQLVLVGNYDEATAMMQAAYASSTAISGGGTAGAIPIWSSASGLTNSAISEVAGAIRALTLTNGGAGATNGTYLQQALTGGSGTGATADIVVSGNVVVDIALRDPGTGYVVGDALSCATIGGAGFVFTVSAVSASDNASGNLTGVRLGANTTSPIATVHAKGAFVSTSSEWMGGGIEFPNRWRSSLTIDSRDEPGGAVTTGTYAWYGIYCIPKIAQTFNSTHYAIYARPDLADSTAAANANLTGALISARHPAYATFTGKSIALTGVNAQVSVSPSVAGNTFGLQLLQTGAVVSPTNPQTINTFTSIGVSSGSYTTNATTITTYYGVRFSAPSTFSGGSIAITNRWAISAEDPLAKSRHYGNFGVGNALDVGDGKVIASLTLTNGGTLYTGGYYAQVPLTGGTGSGATADIAITGGAVVGVTLRNPGQGYVVGDVLSCAAASVGGTGSGFQTTVATTASILRSDGAVLGARIAAGTTNPSMAIYAAGAIGASKFERRYFTDVIVNTLGTRGGTVLQINDTQSELTGVFLAQATLDPAIYGSITIPRVDFSAISVTAFGYGSYSRFICENPTSAGTTALVGGGFDVIMNTAAVGKTIALRGVFANVTLGNLGAGNTISFMRSVDAQSFISTTATQTITDHSMIDCTHSTNTATIQNTTNFYAFRSRAHTWTGAAHTVTNFYGVLLLAPSLSNGATITNRWGISQEDVVANNVFAGKTAMGQAAGTAATAQADLGASTTAAASLRIRTGVAPTTPNDGDIWFDGTALRIRIAGVTRTVTVT